jgi:hypothetical protein
VLPREAIEEATAKLRTQPGTLSQDSRNGTSVESVTMAMDLLMG